MEEKKIEYLELETKNEKLIRVELWFAPILIILPFVLSILLIWSWVIKGYLTGTNIYDQEFFLAIIIIAVNIMFDIPFIKSLRIHK